MAENYHIPVLLKESVDGLVNDPAGTYVDLTFGGGGHSREILKRLTTGTLIAFDQDVDAELNLIDDERFVFVQHNFKYLKNFLKYYNIDKVDGILADLGVSSHDFDVPERGFSFRFEGKLDMRMNQTGSLTAAKIINEYSEEDLLKILKEYGEINNARKVASIIVTARQQKPIETTTQLCGVLEKLVPAKTANKFLAQVFQALRIEVNKELDVLKDLLTDLTTVIKPGGRLVVISYHSLEDRLVKNFILKGDFSGDIEKDFFGNIKLEFKPVDKKMITPSDEEIALNPRARSAKLRIAEKL